MFTKADNIRIIEIHSIEVYLSSIRFYAEFMLWRNVTIRRRVNKVSIKQTNELYPGVKKFLGTIFKTLMQNKSSVE